MAMTIKKIGLRGLSARLVSVAVVLVVVVALAWVVSLRGPAGAHGVPRAAFEPAEFLYLDNDRVRNYLGQLENGLSRSEMRSLNETSGTDVRIDLGKVSVAGTTQTDENVKRVVTPDDANRFYTLRTDLMSAGWLKQLDATSHGSGFASQLSCNVARPTCVHVGDFVQLDGAALLIPSFAAVFAQANYAKQIVAPGQRRVKAALLAPLSFRLRGFLGEYISHVGKDPRLPFRISVTQRGAPRVHVFVPLRMSRMGYQPGLASGPVVIIAKVVRVLPAPDAGASAARRRHDAYVDVETFTSFGRALRRAHPFVLKRLHIRRKDPHLGIKPIVTRAARVMGPGLVLLPIAVFE